MSSAGVERFKKFDFDNDTRWNEYLNALTFPPGRNDLVLKYKAKWYKREIEPDFNIDEVIVPPSTTEKPAPATAPSPPSSSTTRTQQATAPAPGLIDLALLAGHIYLFISCLMALQPFNPILAMKGLAQGNKASLPVHLVRLYKKVGSPSSAPSTIEWIKNISKTTESFHLFLISMANSNPKAWTGIIPVAILALYHISATFNMLFSNSKFSVLWQRVGAAKVHSFLAMHQQTVLHAMAILEIGTFFGVLLSVLRKGPLGFFAVYAFAFQLRGRYWSPESRTYHVNGWRKLGETVQPVLSKVTFAQKIVDRGRNFFESGRPKEE